MNIWEVIIHNSMNETLNAMISIRHIKTEVHFSQSMK